MAEVFSFSEGSAYIWTGNSTTSALIPFVRTVRVGLSITRHSYRVPFATTRTWTELERVATFNGGQAFSDKTGLRFLTQATGGQVHMHITHLVNGPNLSGGFFLYTGTLSDGAFDGGEGQAEQMLGLNASFERWTAY